jgi:hypothetical protein
VTYTLLIWESVPENTTLYLIPDDEITRDQRMHLREADGKLTNCDDGCDGLDFLNAALSPKPEYCADESPAEIRCIWHKYKVAERGETFGDRGVSIKHVYMTGFAL